MARPVAANAQATRQLVLATASRLFSERGEGNTSIRDIATEAGLSLGMVYHYFGSKEGLYDACVEAMYAELASLRDELQATAMTAAPADVLAASVSATFRFARAHRGAIRLLLRDVISEGEMRSDRQERYLIPFLGEGAALMTALVGGSLDQNRLLVQTMSHAMVRYAVTSTRELALVCGLAVNSESDLEELEQMAVLAIEAHLADVARKLLGL